MYTPMVSCFLALLVMVPVESFRLSSEHVRASSNSEEVIKTIEGVPVYNYQLAFEKVKKIEHEEKNLWGASKGTKCKLDSARQTRCQ
jgi:hypothetical protein